WPRTDTPTPETYTLSLHDALPICRVERGHRARHRAGDGLLERGQVRHLGDQGGLVVERGAHRRQGARGDDVLGVLADQEAQEVRSEEHTSELQSRENLVCRLLLEK